MISIHELSENEIPLIINYWTNSSAEYLSNMGADKSKLPPPKEFFEMLKNQIELPVEEKNSYCLIWELEGKAIGHCNTNPTSFGKSAYMHVHIWEKENRKKGMGIEFLELSIQQFFEALQLKELYSQPMTSNLAPNKTLKKLGFQLIETKTCVPGSINFEQEVNVWRKAKDEI